MRYDAVVIGGGLAGYAAGLRLLEAGRTCALISAGQSALHFSSGSFDFLHSLPDGTAVPNPIRALDALAAQNPEHPYARIGLEKTVALAQEAEVLLPTWGVSMRGSLVQGNHYRVTPLGRLMPTWLSAADALCARKGDTPFAWSSAVLVSLEGFLDAYPEIVRDQLSALGVKVTCRSLSVPALNMLRNNPSEFRSVNIARVLDNPGTLSIIAGILQNLAEDVEAILLPACLGLRDWDLVGRLSRRLGKAVHLIPTLPPSLLGTRIATSLSRAFLDKGGVPMPGDKAVRYTLAHNRHGAPVVRKLYTVNHEDVPLEARQYILATGGFFSRGLEAGQREVREPLFGLDMFRVPPSREEWTSASVFAPQPYAGFGVRTDAFLRAYRDGRSFANLRVAGMVLGGYDPVRLGCGAGVALVSALAAADAAVAADDQGGRS